LNVDLVLFNTKAFIENHIVNCSIAIDKGKISKIGSQTNMPKAEARIDLKNLLVLPGLIDAHVHLRDEGKAYKEDFCTGTAAAAAGGFTTVLDMPNNEPVTMSAETLRNRMSIAAKRILVNVGFYSEFPKKTSEIKSITHEGPVAFKLFMSQQIGGLQIDNDAAISEALRTLTRSKTLLAAHAEDHRTLKEKEVELKRTHRDDIKAFLSAHTETVETTAVNRLTKIAAKTRSHVHICHVTSEKALEAVTQAKKTRAKVSCEVTPHHLLLSRDNLMKSGFSAIMVPPLRAKQNLNNLWTGIRSGTIDIVASDHAPHSWAEKNVASVWNVKVGIPGLETLAPLLLTEVNRGRLSIADFVRLLAHRPAEIFGLKKKGNLKKNSDADLTVIDLGKKGVIDPSEFHSKAKYSPFGGWKVHGKPVMTFVNGRLTMVDDKIVGEAGSGRVVRKE
jgi:dihydroorotase